MCKGEGMLLIASSNSCKPRSEHAFLRAKRCVLRAYVPSSHTDRGHMSSFMIAQFCFFNLFGCFFHLPWFYMHLFPIFFHSLLL